MKTILIMGGIFAALIGLVWLGLQIQPKQFSPYQGESKLVSYQSLPENLPAPVRRFYQEVYGERIPLISSAVISGTAELRVQGLTFPARFRFVHQAGDNYRHYIEATFFGFPIMKVREKYLDGVGRMELPFGVIENDPQVNQGANLALWAEAIWFPSIYLTDPDASWEPVDACTAILIVPYQDQEERFIARFDPDTGLLTTLESMRFKGADSQSKTLWINQARVWSEVDGFLIPRVGEVTWFDEGKPWAVFTIEELVINAEVGDFLRAEGP